MKKIINLLFIIPLLVTLASCYEDKGNYDYINLPDIAIKAKDTVNVTQLHTLEIPADVNLNGEAETDYEIYFEKGRSGLFCELWIPVRKK